VQGVSLSAKITAQIHRECANNCYFFLYPAGHFGFIALTVFTLFPLKHLIVFTTVFGAEVVGEAVGVTSAVFACDSLILIVGALNEKP